MDQNNTPSNDNATVAAVLTDPTIKQKPIKERKKGPPASRVFNAAVLAAAIAECNGNVDAARLKLYDKGEVLITGTADSVSLYVKGYREQAPHEGSGGYSSFATKHDAFTNQDMLKTFTVQGVARMMALLIARAAEYLMEGGEKAQQMSDALKGLDAYRSVALDEAKKMAEDKALNDAIATVAKARGCTLDEARAMLANFAVQPSTPAPQAAAVAPITAANDNLPSAETTEDQTLAESGAALNDGGEGIPEGESNDLTEAEAEPVAVGGGSEETAPKDDGYVARDSGKKNKKNRHR